MACNVYSSSSSKSLLDFFYDGLKAAPTSPAVKFDDGNVMSELSYVDSDQESDVIAAHLADLSVENEIICVSSVKHVSSISVIIGVLKIPAAFSYVDFNNSPWEQLLSYLKALGACYVFIKEDEFKTFTDKGISAEIMSRIECKAGTLILMKLQEVEGKKYCYPNWSLAYAIQTSGSTGVPKAVKVPNRCIVPNIIHFRAEYRVTSKDVIYVASPFTFDPSLVDIFLALSAGACALLVPNVVKATPHKLMEILVVRNKITLMQVAPSLLRFYGRELLRTTVLSADSSLRILGLGGEACPPKSTLLSWKSPDCKVTMYNLYGITEVSAWATLHRIDFDLDKEEIPLGEIMTGTEVQVIDEEGRVLKSAGTGQAFLGGHDRICFLGWEDDTEATKRPMRASGDLVRLTTDGRLFYLGRLDDQIRRFGIRMFPKQIEKIAKSLPEIEDCCALFHQEKGHLILIIIIRQNHRNESRLVKEKLKTFLVQNIPSHGIPDLITDVSFFPVTANGKINKRQLIEMSYLENALADVAVLDRETICSKIQQLWMLNVGSGRSIQSSDKFLFVGGDSLKAIYVCEQVQLWLRMRCPLLVDKLMNSNFLDVCDYLNDLVKTTFTTEFTEMKASTSEETITDSNLETSSSSAETSVTRVVSRGNAQLHKSLPESISPNSAPTASQRKRPVFGLSWKYDTGKCVDASPLVVCSEEGSTVFVGSHSRRFSAVSLDSGLRKWEFKAEDRIESSACACDNGKRIYFGSYDQHLYCLDASSGAHLWKFKSEGLIKSSPAYDRLNNLVYFGSYDHLVYAINALNGECVWKTQLGQGSVFSSVCVCYSPHQIYAGTLDGILGALHPQSGEVLWKSNLNSPIFSSCALVPHGICVGCVDHTLNCFDHRGNKMWSYRCEGPVFSSPAVASSTSASGQLVVFGSHDGNVYCLRAQTGDLRWKTPLSSAVYSTAFVRDDVVFTCCTNGLAYALSLDSGEILSKHEFPGETFSSPLVVQNRLLVGCRDNNLYCLDVGRL